MLGMNVNLSFRRSGLRVALRKRQNQDPGKAQEHIKGRDNRLY